MHQYEKNIGGKWWQLREIWPCASWHVGNEAKETTQLTSYEVMVLEKATINLSLGYF